MLALYHFGPVANSLTPLLCLLEKGLPFDNHHLNSRNWDHHTPEFRKISPDGMVPVLVHDGRPLTESTVINEYLDGVFPEVRLRPADEYDRAQMRIWTKYVDEVFCPALTVLGAQGAAPYASRIDKAEMARRLASMPNEDVRRKWEIVSSGGYSEAQIDEARGKLRRVAEKMEAQLATTGEWILDCGYSLADIKLYSMAPGLERLTPELCNERVTPHLVGWLRRMEERPAVQAARAMQRPV